MPAMNKTDALGLLEEHGAIVSGHFQLAGGLHTPIYIQAALVLQYPHVAQKLSKALAAKFPQPLDVVVTPGAASLVLGQELARIKKCRAIFAERSDGSMAFRRDFKIERGERVLVAVDVLTTGRLTGELAGLALAYGAKVVGVGALVDRSNSGLALAVPARALVNYPLEACPQGACAQCRLGVPLTDLSRLSSGGQEGY